MHVLVNVQKCRHCVPPWQYLGKAVWLLPSAAVTFTLGNYIPQLSGNLPLHSYHLPFT